MTDSNLPDPKKNIADAADAAHDKVNDLVPEDKQDQAHDAVDNGQDAAKHAADAAQSIVDAASKKAAPVIDQATDTYKKSPRRFQIIAVAVIAVVAFVILRRTAKP